MLLVQTDSLHALARDTAAHAGAAGRARLLGIPLLGASADSGKKLLLSLALVAIVVLIGVATRTMLGPASRGSRSERVRFWIRQAVHVLCALLLVAGLIAI